MIAITSHECFRKGRKGEGLEFRETPEHGEAAREKDEKSIRCRICHHYITAVGAALEIEGKQKHTFFNPAGIVFEISLYDVAPGCEVSGVPTSEFTWFKGFAWQYAHCAGCKSHLGWHWLSGGASFFGLIGNRIVEMDAPRETF